MATDASTSEHRPSPMRVGGEVGQSSQEIKGLTYKVKKGYSPYIIRFYPFSQDDTQQLYDMDSVVFDFLSDQYPRWFISEETKPKLHFHIYIESKMTLTQIKEKIKQFIYPYYPERKRGFGNKQYNCQSSESPLKAIIYATKQRGAYEYSGFQEDFIEQCKSQSFEKTESEFEKEMNVLTDDFLNSNQCPYEFSEKLCILYSHFDKRIHFRDIQGYVNSKIIKRNPKEASALVRKNLHF